MTDKEYRVGVRRISKLADRWLETLGLEWWSVHLRYHREGISGTPEDASGGWVCSAKTSVKWEYLNATIDWNMLQVIEMDDEKLERVFVHECCHVLINEMRMWAPETMSQEKIDEAMKHEERVVTSLTNAFLWTRGTEEKSRKEKKLK